MEGLPVGGVEVWVVEFTSFGGVGGDAFEGHEEEGVFGGVGEFFADDFGDAVLFFGVEARDEDVGGVPGDLVVFVSGGNFGGLVDEDAEVLGATGDDDLGEAKLPGDGEAVGATCAEDAEDAVGDFAKAVVEDGVDDSFFHHLFHGVTTGADGVEGDDLVAGFFKEFDGVHGALSEDAEVGHADDALGAFELALALARPHGFCDAFLCGLGHAPGGGGGVCEDFAGEDVEAEDVGDGEHHGDVLDADEGGGVAGGGGGKHDFGEAVGEGLEDGGAGGGSLGATEGDDGVDFFGLLEVEQELGGSGDDEGVGLFAVGFDEEFVEVAAASGDDFLFGDVCFEVGVADEGEVDEEGLAAEGLDFGAHEVGFIGFGVESC